MCLYFIFCMFKIKYKVMYFLNSISKKICFNTIYVASHIYCYIFLCVYMYDVEEKNPFI